MYTSVIPDHQITVTALKKAESLSVVKHAQFSLKTIVITQPFKVLPIQRTRHHFPHTLGPLITAYNFSSREPKVIFRTPWTRMHTGGTYTHREIHIDCIIKMKKN